MPDEWQKRFVELMEDDAYLAMNTPNDYVVQKRNRVGKFDEDPWSDYRHGDIEEIDGQV
jgi:hypothetical protein